MIRDFELPEQDVDTEFKGLRGGFAGFLAGMIAGTVPGVGAAGSTTFLSPLMEGRNEFLAGMGGVNTTDIIASLLALIYIGKARSGASVALQSIKIPLKSDLMSLVGLSVFCGGLSALLALRSEKIFLYAIDRVSFDKVGLSILGVLLILSFYLAGFYGVLTLLTASLIGFYSLLRSTRACSMAVLLVPAILFFI
jgi:putative membrane protein